MYFGLMIHAWVTMESAQGRILGHVGQQFISLSLVLREDTVWGSATSLLFLLSTFELLAGALSCAAHLEVVMRLPSFCRHVIVPPFAHLWSRLISSETSRHRIALLDCPFEHVPFLRKAVLGRRRFPRYIALVCSETGRTLNMFMRMLGF